MNKFAVLTASLWALGTSAYASDASFNEAVNLYLKGYADCHEANSLRSDDIKAARERFDNYLKILDQASAIDPSILKTAERDMDANLTYCERVHDNLKMAEAAPLLEAGFEHCNAAKTALAGNDFAAAQQALDAYAVQRDQALAITGNIMEVFSLASQVRACSRLEEKLAGARKANEVESAAIADLQQQLNHYSQKCQLALSFTRQPQFTVDTIDQANHLLAEAQHFRKQASTNAVANKALQREPEPAEATDLKQTEAAAERCEAEVASQIRNMGKQRSLTEQTLDAAIADLQQATRECNDGLKQLSAGGGHKAVASTQQQVRKQIQEGSTPAIAALAKRHPAWPQSKNWQQLSTQAEQCKQNLGAALAKAEPTPVKPIATPPPQTAQQSTPQEKAVQETAQQLPQTPEPPIAAPSSKPAIETSNAPILNADEPTAAGYPPRRADDWTNLADEPEQAPESELKEKRQIRKSWTDLVK